jgi:uncharacterized membrane protein
VFEVHGRSARRLAHALAVLATLGLPGAVQAGYIVQEVAIAGADGTSLWDVNNAGTLVGFAGIAGSTIGATAGFVLESGGTVTTLTGPAGAISSYALGISDTGTVVGSYVSTSTVQPDGSVILGPSTGFIYTGGFYTTFTVVGATDTFLRGISPDARYVSGYYSTAAEAGIGFVYDVLSATFTPVSVADSIFTIAQGINSAGQLAGSDTLSGPPTTSVGFVYDMPSATRTDLTIAGASSTRLRSIDDNGVLAGWFVDPFGTHGFIGSTTSYEQIDFAGADATYVEGSNNARWAVGTAYVDGVAHGFLAKPTPVDEPGSLLLLLGGLGALAQLRRRQS